MQLHLVMVGPLIQGLGGELRPMVDDDLLRHPLEKLSNYDGDSTEG